MWDIYGQCHLARAERAEVRHIPVQADQAKQALDKAGPLPQRHAEHDLHRPAGLDGSVAANSLDGSVAANSLDGSVAANSLNGSVAANSLNGSIAVNRMSPTRACRLRSPRHVRIKPDRKRSAALERLAAGGPVQGLAGRCVRSAHPPKLSPKLNKTNPSLDLCNRASRGCRMSDQFWLTGGQMERLKPFFPSSHGVSRVDDRRVLSGVIFFNRNGLRWRDAPAVYGPHKTLYNRWFCWSQMGVFGRIPMELVRQDAETEIIMIDATHLKAHRTASSLWKKRGAAG